MLKRNLIANYLGEGWAVLMALVFIPLYIKYLGIEAFGLIGLFAVLQAWLSLLDMGMTPTLNREMARFSGGSHSAQSIRDLLRSIEIIALAIATLVGLGIWAASGWLASDWLRAEKLPIDIVAQAFVIMGAVTALRFVEGVYRSCIIGLQRQVQYNIINSSLATLRGLGAVGILIWVSPTIVAFFIWQGLVSILAVGILAGSTYHLLPKAARAGRFSMPALQGIGRFAGGMLGITFLALLLTQVDKILLSRLLSLEYFGYYAFAGLVSGALLNLAYPIQVAYFPRFTELLTKGDSVGLSRTYHQGAQLVTVIIGSAAVVLMIYAHQILQIWTNNGELAQQVAPLVAILALGTLLNGLAGIPYRMQLAHGWTSLAVKINCVAVTVLIPALIWIVPEHGAIGAAWIWVALNSGYILIGMHFMYRRILPNEKWVWYREDILLPLAVASLTALACYWVMPSQTGRLGSIFVILTSYLTALTLASLSAPLIREQVIRKSIAWLLFLKEPIGFTNIKPRVSDEVRYDK